MGLKHGSFEQPRRLTGSRRYDGGFHVLDVFLPRGLTLMILSPHLISVMVEPWPSVMGDPIKTRKAAMNSRQGKALLDSSHTFTPTLL